MTAKDLQLYKENNNYYLSAILQYEDKNGIYEVSVPKIRLFISSNITMDIDTCYDIWNKTTRFGSVDFGFGKLSIEPFNDDRELFTTTCIEEKVYKMTLAEIEEELGYKIEIVKEKE